MADMKLIREGLDLIVEKTGNHQSVVEFAEGDVTKGFARLATAQQLMQKAIDELREAKNHFDTAKERTTLSRKDNLEVVHNVASAIGLAELEGDNASGLHAYIGALTEKTDLLTHQYEVNSMLTKDEIGEGNEAAGLWQLEATISAHLSASGRQTTAIDFNTAAAQTIEAARNFEI